jgi:transposase
MSPEYVRPYVKAHKNDDRDAEAIAEAASRPTMRFVELKLKSEAQLDLQTLHRVRSRLVAARKTLLNQLRAILLERGHTLPRERRMLQRALDTQTLKRSARREVMGPRGLRSVRVHCI